MKNSVLFLVVCLFVNVTQAANATSPCAGILNLNPEEVSFVAIVERAVENQAAKRDDFENLLEKLARGEATNAFMERPTATGALPFFTALEQLLKSGRISAAKILPEITRIAAERGVIESVKQKAEFETDEIFAPHLLPDPAPSEQPFKKQAMPEAPPHPDSYKSFLARILSSTIQTVKEVFYFSTDGINSKTGVIFEHDAHIYIYNSADLKTRPAAIRPVSSKEFYFDGPPLYSGSQVLKSKNGQTYLAVYYSLYPEKRRVGILSLTGKKSRHVKKLSKYTPMTGVVKDGIGYVALLNERTIEFFDPGFPDEIAFELPTSFPQANFMTFTTLDKKTFVAASGNGARGMGLYLQDITDITNSFFIPFPDASLMEIHYESTPMGEEFLRVGGSLGTHLVALKARPKLGPVSNF